MASRRMQQPGKSSPSVDPEHNQIRIEFACIPDDLVLHETDGDLEVHWSIQGLG